ncbi:MAG: DNA translocase FtsK [Planctomycetota bacterium]|jgi:S-DNA-T family DNA segregation ATPase FtsK/SpoIIIE
MAHTVVRARQWRSEELPATGVVRRVGWLALASLWVFVAVSLVTFDAADWPSHTVAVHNHPTRNLCGASGAFIAYHGFLVLGTGSWVLLAGLGAYLGAAAVRRPLGMPLVRGAGLLLVAVSVCGIHGLLTPDLGSLTGARAGLLAAFLVPELTHRFSAVGTLLIFLVGLGIGSIVAADQLLAAVPRLVRGALGVTGAVARGPGLAAVRALRARPAEDRRRRWLSRRRRPAAIDSEPGDFTTADPDDTEEPEGERRQRLTPEELRAKLAKLPARVAGAALADDEEADEVPAEEDFEGYQFPSLDLLQDPESNYSRKMEAFVVRQAEQLEAALETYGIEGEVAGIESGPVVTLYSVELAPGTKVARLQAVASDLARALRAQNIRIVPNMVGKTAVGIEVPNLHKERVRLKELMTAVRAESVPLPMYLGKDVSGEPLVANLTRMPHMLIAGTTGSGKSVCINTIIMSWLYTKRPDELKLVLVDPKMVELGQFQEIPHLLCPVVTETSRAVAILQWAANKMEERYELLREASVRNVAAYNRLDEEELYERFDPANDVERAKIPKKLPYIVFIIDELADLIMTHKEVEHSIVRIAQKARAVGIHLIVATQRPQANVVTGLIKSNMPCRVSFKVASGMDSRIVMDQKGAELLLGQGDMLFLTPHTTQVRRAQGTLVTDIEIRRVVRFLRTVAAPSFERSLIAIRPVGDPEAGEEVGEERDPLFDEAVEIMIETGRGSVSLLQRRLAIGYTRSSRLVDQMYVAGILGDHKGSVAREVLITSEEWAQMKVMEEAAEAKGTLFAEPEEAEELDEEVDDDEDDIDDLDDDEDELEDDEEEDEDEEDELEDDEEEEEDEELEEDDEEEVAAAEPPMVETIGDEQEVSTRIRSRKSQR